MSNPDPHDDPVFRGVDSHVVDQVLDLEKRMEAKDHQEEVTREHDRGNQIEGAARHMHDNMDRADRSELDAQLNHFAHHGK